jgi:hypothetical protein
MPDFTYYCLGEEERAEEEEIAGKSWSVKIT